MEERSQYISLKQASKLTPYDANYLGLLVRNKRLKAIKKGDKWLTKKEDVLDYLAEVSKKARDHRGELGVVLPEERSQRVRRLVFAVLFIIVVAAMVFFVVSTNRNQGAEDYRIQRDENNNLQIFLKGGDEIESVIVTPEP
jgi:hypothetical protein